MKPNTTKSTSDVQISIDRYVKQRKLDLLTKVFRMLNNTQWTWKDMSFYDKLLDKFIDLSKGFEEEKLKEEMKLKNIMKSKLIQKKVK